ncbi:CG14110 [Drosophila busckii]|uniref:CG14110 n=1 Tax=Drosophila busckii TaxID=30019 RepID=A0A0M5IYZ4_DROBS|nr:CG14110 [Drosophila busckii]
MLERRQRVRNYSWQLLLLLLLLVQEKQAAPTETTLEAVQQDLGVEARARIEPQDELLAEEEDLDGRSAYVNNQFVPNEPVELVDDEQNAPLYEILQKQMEQVLANTAPDVALYKDDKSKRQPAPQKPQFISSSVAAADEDYEEESMEAASGYNRPDALTPEEELPALGYQQPQLKPADAATTTSTSTSAPSTSSNQRNSPNRPSRRRSTTALPRTTQHRNVTTSSTTPLSSTTTATPTPTTVKPSSTLSSSPHDPHVLQQKRRIIFKTISTGSQFVNSPIGDLMIKFSIGYAKPLQALPISNQEALRALSSNLLRSREMQKLLKLSKVPRD